MVLRDSGKCILSCSKSCINNSTQTFKDVICPHHLSQVFGLKVNIERFEDTSTTHLVGPYLIVDDNFNFEPNTVVFPERDFIDQSISIKETNENYYTYKINPRMKSYLDELLGEQSNISKTDARYQLDAIRNLFFPKTTDAKLNLAKGSEESNIHLLRTLEKRFNELDTIIQTEDYNKIFDKFKITNVSSNETVKLESFTPFMRFMIFNCLISEHKPPTITDDTTGITNYFNLLYKPGVGFVCVQPISNPCYLSIGGEMTGNNNYYQLKVRNITKRTVQNSNSIFVKNLADNLRSSNLLNINKDFCWGNN